jgi:anti-sigma factor RsiW
MPWVIRGDAPAAQDEWLQTHLAGCHACREEFAQQERLREALSLPSDLPLDADAGLARLMARIDEDEARPPVARRLASSGWLVRGLVAAVLVQAIGIGVLGIKLRGETPPAPVYRTLSQEEAPAAAGSLRVVPQSTMKVAEWNKVLQDLHLHVTGGPNDVGAYTLVSEDGKAASDETLKRLRATQGIRFAEPVAGAP